MQSSQDESHVDSRRRPVGGESAQRPSLQARNVVLLLVAFGAAVALANAAVPHFSYNRWDNFEYFTPTLLDAHGRWLAGHVPLWTSRQHLGEPLLANAQPGVLYPPYTLAVATVRVLGRPEWLMGVVAALHIAIGLAGWFALFRLLGLRPWLAGVAALSTEGGGFAAIIIPLWIFMGGVLAWIPWVLYGSLRALRDPEDLAGLWVPAGLFLLAGTGHPQMLAYAWLWLLVTAGAVAWANRSPARALARWMTLMGSGALLSAPVLVPAFLLSRSSARAGAFSFAEYSARSVHPSELVGLILPVLRSAHGYLGTVGSLSFYQGSWVALSLGAGVVALAWRSGGRSGDASGDQPEVERAMRRRFLCACAVAVLFVLLSLGRWGGLMRLLYGVPIWSSFRWPFKFLLFAGPSLSIAAGLGAEMWLRRLSREGDPGGLRLGLVLWGALLLGAADLAGWIGRHPVYSLAFAALFLLSAVALTAGERRWSAALLLVCSWSGVALAQAFAQVPDMKRYDEPLGAFGPAVLGIDPADRVLPVSSDQRPDGMQPFAQYQSASANGYDAATGTTTAMAPSWYLRVFPSNTAALLPDSSYLPLLASPLLKTLDVRYAVVRNTDRRARDWLDLAGFRLVRPLPESSVYEQDGVLPRVYFATEARPYSSAAVRDGLMYGGVPLRTAYVDGVRASEVLPDARVLGFYPEENGVRAHVDAPRGGLIVFSSTYYPQWRVFADGARLPAVRVNGLVTGARIPPGTKTVEFRFGIAGLGLLGLLTAGGLLTLGLWTATRRRAAGSPTYPT